jgi:hypothetical protein
MAKFIFKEDINQTKALVKAGRIAAERAYKGSKALGLTVSYIKDGIVYSEDASGHVVKIKTIETTKPPFEIKKGLILHAK